MMKPSSDNWSICLAQPCGIELRFHILWPLTLLFTLLIASESFSLGPFGRDLSLWTLGVLFASVTLHEVARVFAALRVGGHAHSLVLSPIGGLTKLQLPVDPPAHLVVALAGPLTYLVLMVVAGCYLVAGNHEVLPLLLNPLSPDISTLHLGTKFSMLHLLAQLTVWINGGLLLISFLPIDPCDGAELLRGILWPLVGRSTATSLTSRIALGGAVITGLLAILAASYAGTRIPAWFPLAGISIFLLYGGYRNSSLRRYDAGLAIDEFDSDDEQWLSNDWDTEEREVVLVEHLQDKQQEVLDRKRREREAHEDARVDAILERLRDIRFDQLSEEDRATLKRASRRYRRRRSEENHAD